ncbi:carbonic anhydrase-related protein [Drosophila pseudoobscura]|uniref:Carbonic anhydrase-related protein n=1 Tax=Drosophila pseudoobscura pseudoobscura TaxID=46245 RepID=A0A6I8UU56_DROPS|nr:carbonic anhydrase-related protein [Drosophila pseudoobscura]
MLDTLWDIFYSIVETNAFKIFLSMFMTTLIMFRVGPFACLSFLFEGNAQRGAVAVPANRPSPASRSRPPAGVGPSRARGESRPGSDCVASGQPNTFDYGAIRGPHSWNVPTNNQSPVNINQPCMENSYFETPLQWTNGNVLPDGIRLENNGHTVVLRASYPGCVPSIDGGDLLGRFEFREISFRWSWSSNMGSEHTVDNRHYPLEMQCLHTAAQTEGCISSQSIVMISYMFEVGEDNPYLEVLIQHLVTIKKAGRSVEVPPFPISYLVTPFYTQFFSYQGSLTEPPCHRGVEWLINPDPLAISERQLNEFRQLRSYHGARIGSNARPVQPLGDRAVFYNHYRRRR